MATYEYTALNPANAILRGSVTGWTKQRAAQQLIAQQLTVVTMRRAARTIAWRKFLPNRVTSMDRILLTRNLMTMIKAGMTFSEALASVKDQTTNVALQRILQDTEQRIQAGQTLSSAWQRYPMVFSNEYTAMITIGERSGKLVEVLEFLTKKLEAEYRLIRKIRNALTYPALILGAMVVIVAIMILFVIPKVSAIYQDAGVALPIFTRILIAISAFVSNYFLYVFLALAVAFVLIDLGLRRWPAMRRLVDASLLRIPKVGPVIKKLNLAIISRSTAMLLQAGITIDKAMLLAADAARNRSYQDALRTAEPFVTRGVQLTDAFRGRPDLFLPVFHRMVTTGERAGNLDSMFTSVAQYYDDELEYWTANVSAIIEPAMIIAVGLIVAGIAMAILYPLWNFVNVIN